MKKYKLEISIFAIFGLLVTGLLWKTLADKFQFLPYVSLGIFGVVLLSGIFTPSGSAEAGDVERYAPKFFAKTLLSSVVGIALIVGLAAVLNRDRFSKTFDLTERKINSLSDETIKFLTSLDKEVAIYCVPAMDARSNYCNESEHLRALYAEKSPKIKHTAIALQDFAALQQVKPTGYERLVLMVQDNKTEVTGSITESKLTNGLMNLVRSKKMVYFLTGSGEPSVSAEGGRNYQLVTEILKQRAYEVKEHSITEGDLPADAQLVVAGSNTSPYTPVVENMLRKFLAKGGRVVLTINPYRNSGLERLLDDVGVTLENKLLVGNRGATQLGAQLAEFSPMRPPIIVGEFSKDSEITSPLNARDVAIADGARPLKTKALAEGGTLKVKHTNLMQAMHAAPATVSDSQRDTLNLDGPLNVDPDSGFDPQGKFLAGVQVEIEGAKKLSEGIPASQLASKDGTGLGSTGDTGSSDGKAEMVVFGFDLASKFERAPAANLHLLPLAVAHLHRDKELVSIPHKDTAPKQFKLERNPGSFVALFAMILPVITALAGFYIFMRRRSA